MKKHDNKPNSPSKILCLALFITFLLNTTVRAGGSDPITIQSMTNFKQVGEALAEVKTILLKYKFINTDGIHENSFTAKRTTGSTADYYIADVTAALQEKSVKVTISFVKVGSGFLKLGEIADQVKADLQPLSNATPTSPPNSGTAINSSSTPTPIPNVPSTENAPSLDATVAWVIKNTAEVDVDDVQYFQKMQKSSKDDNCLMVVSMSQTSPKGSTLNETYTFSLGNLDESSVKFTVKGKIISIEVMTTIKDGNRQKVIKHTKDEELQGYETSFQILVSTPEKANSYVEALKYAIKQCKQGKKSWFEE